MRSARCWVVPLAPSWRVYSACYLTISMRVSRVSVVGHTAGREAGRLNTLPCKPGWAVNSLCRVTISAGHRWTAQVKGCEWLRRQTRGMLSRVSITSQQPGDEPWPAPYEHGHSGASKNISDSGAVLAEGRAACWLDPGASEGKVSSSV